MPGLMWPHLRHPREVAAMVEEQASRWTMKDGRWEPVLGRWPVVTLSCEADDQGQALGRSLAALLGFSYWDRALVIELVRLLNPEGAPVSIRTERTRAGVEAFLGSFAASRRVISVDDVDRTRLVIDSILRRGGAVLAGRGAQFLVPPRQALRVRLVAPTELRPSGGAVGDAANFDVVLNGGTYDPECALGLALMAYLAKFGDWPMAARQVLLHGRRLDIVPLLQPLTPSCLMGDDHEQNRQPLTSTRL